MALVDMVVTQGEMTGASWVDIVQHDERKVARQKSQRRISR